MSRSLSHSVGQPSGTFTHDSSGTRFEVKSGDRKGEISLSRAGLNASYPIAYVIGSGAHASGDIVSVGSYLFQSPVSFFTRKDKWDMAPGYENAAEPDFTRPVTGECLACHAGRARLVPNTLNRFEPIEPANEAISCERCHGDSSAHLAHPGRDTIINPKRLPTRARDSVCEQCHLMGEARILNPGRQFTDFRPGQDLEDTFSVYVRDDAGSPAPPEGSIRVISHAEQLRLSLCARRSEGKLWCGTCHNPHQKPDDRVSYFRDRCLSCHGQALLQTHAKPVDDCVGCHMPTRKAKDGAHTVFTDHRITRRPPPTALHPEPNDRVAKIVAWNNPGGRFAERNLGLAEIEVGERQESTALLEEGAGRVIEAMKSLPPDPVILTKLGVVLLRSGAAADAIEPLEYALKLEPERAGSHVNLANAYRETGQKDRAISELQRAIELDPSLEAAYRALGEIYAKSGDQEKVRESLRLYLRFMPNNMMARQALATGSEKQAR